MPECLLHSFSSSSNIQAMPTLMRLLKNHILYHPLLRLIVKSEVTWSQDLLSLFARNNMAGLRNVSHSFPATHLYCPPPGSSYTELRPTLVTFLLPSPLPDRSDRSATARTLQPPIADRFLFADRCGSSASGSSASGEAS